MAELTRFDREGVVMAAPGRDEAERLFGVAFDEIARLDAGAGKGLDPEISAEWLAGLMAEAIATAEADVQAITMIRAMVTGRNGVER